VFRIDKRGIYLILPDKSLSLVNPRLMFPVVDRYPCLKSEHIMAPPTSRTPPTLNVYPADTQIADSPLRRVNLEQIAPEVESYLSLLTHLPPIQLYIAVRAYESSLISLPQLNRIAGLLTPQTTLAGVLLQQRMCTWEDLLSVCLDIARPGAHGHVPPPAEYELVGEIMVAIGRLTRTQLQRALNIKRDGDKPLGEILLQMGACKKTDIENCLQAQEKVGESLEHRVGLLGELLVQYSVVTYEDLQQALRIQRIGRQPLHAVLISMGTCTQHQMNEFMTHHPHYVTQDGFDEKVLAQYLIYHRLANSKQLDEARRLQDKGRLVLGELLVELKKCTQRDIEGVLGTQQSIREAAAATANANPQKIGQMLVHNNVVQLNTVEKAVGIQERSRQQFGAMVADLGACSRDDFNDALELQFSWRQRVRQTEDKLGQELLKDGLVDKSNLDRALDIHSRAGRPLGQILVEGEACTPETVIETLIKRDDRRRMAFIEYLNEQSPPLEDEQPSLISDAASEPRPSLVNKISSWLGKRNINQT